MEIYSYQKKRIGIVGLWTGTNYGAVLNAWSLYSFLEDKGYEPYLIDFLDGVNQESKCGQFIRSACRIRECGGIFSEPASLNGEMDIFLTGSDQCWRGGYEGGFIRRYGGFKYFLNFTENEKKRISYATSFGVREFEGTEEEKLLSLKYLKRYSAISVREKQSAALYEKKLGMDVAWTIDPIFLKGRESFFSLLKSSSFFEENGRDNKRENLLGFFLDFDDNKRRLYESIAVDMGGRGTMMLGADYTNEKNLDLEGVVTDAGVEGFLALIYMAEEVLTDSYHAMCFAILFHKPFYVVLNEKRGGERFTSLLETLDLMSRIIDPMNTVVERNEAYKEKIDWERVDKRITEMVRFSSGWLLNALESPVKPISGPLHAPEMILSQLEDRYLQQKYQIRELEIHLKNLDGYCDTLRDNLFRTRGAMLKQYVDERLMPGDVIAIRGGGDHTEKLLTLLSATFLKKMVQIAYIIDKRRPDFSFPVGCEHIEPSKMAQLRGSVSKIIISSSKHGNEMKKDALSFFEPECIIDPYDAFPDGELLPGQGWYDM